MPSLETGVYEHYKGNRYEVLGVGLYTETEEPMVIYKPLHETNVPYWVRPYDNFIESVMIDAGEKPRFAKVAE